MRRRSYRLVAEAALLLLCFSTAGAQPVPGEHVFRGKVQSVNAKAGILMVDGENVEGWAVASQFRRNYPRLTVGVQGKRL